MLNHLKILNGMNLIQCTCYSCPLCMSKFDEEAIGRLTEEDVPQASLGGKRITLTCQHCNSTCGHTMDANLRNAIVAIENKRFLAGTDRKVNIFNEGKRLGAKLLIDAGRNMCLEIDTNRNDPKIWTDYKDNILIVGAVINLHDVPQKINARLISAAILKNAYLLLFAQTGYTFLIDAFYNRFRNQINNPLPFILPEGLWTFQNIQTADGIYLSKHNRIRGFFVIYTLEKTLKHKVCVFIPTPKVPYEAAVLYLKQIEAHDKVRIEKLSPSFDFLKSQTDILRLRKWCYGWGMTF